MNRFFASILLLCLATTSQAQLSQADRVEVCTQMAETAVLIMAARQNGVPMSDLMQLVPIVEDKADKAMVAMIESLIIAAYDIPVYLSDQRKTSVISDFRDKITMICYQNSYSK